MVDKVKQGKRNRANGAAFELRTRKDLEAKNWIVDKWSNNVELCDNEGICNEGYACDACPISGKLIPAKRKYNAFSKVMAIGTGFPDFACSSWLATNQNSSMYEFIGVECKSNGKLDKIEKEKCRWLLDNHIFSKILIAEKTKPSNKIVIVYHDFEDKYGVVTK